MILKLVQIFRWFNGVGFPRWLGYVHHVAHESTPLVLILAPFYRHRRICSPAQTGWFLRLLSISVADYSIQGTNLEGIEV